MRNIIFLSGLLVITIAFKTNNKESYKVEYKGGLMEIMHEGDISARIDLRSLKQKQHLYALGSVENLKGEIIVLDGNSYISQINEAGIKTTETFENRASLLVYTQVQEWIKLTVPDSVHSYTQDESYLPEIARQKGININKPFPFLIEGNASLNWHVIDWKKGDTEHTHEKHRKSGAKGIIKDSPSTILGFYSQKHQRIWTHHSTYLHMHALMPKENLSVHIDDLMINPGTTLKIPKT